MSTEDDSSKDSKKRCGARIRVLLSVHIARVMLMLMLLLLAAFLVLSGSPSASPNASISASASTTTSTTTSASTSASDHLTAPTGTKNEAWTTGSTSSEKQQQTTAAAPKKKKPPAPDFTNLGNCTFASPPSRTEWTTKPLWFPAFPSTLDDPVYKSLVSSLTGLPAGAKSFYASSKPMKLRHCFGTTETAACINIHPVVEMTPGPAAKADLFDFRIVVSLRNPTTVLPAFLNAKRIKYAKLPGQQPENDWRQARDQFIGGLMEQYRHSLHAWKQPPYRVAMYLVVEDLMQNHEPVRQLAAVLQTAGFPVAAPEALECIWFRSVGGSAALQHYRQHGYEFDDYLPGYTEAQRDMFLRQLTEMMQDYRDDAALVKILQRYHDEIRDTIRLDHPWVNETATL